MRPGLAQDELAAFLLVDEDPIRFDVAVAPPLPIPGEGDDLSGSGAAADGSATPRSPHGASPVACPASPCVSGRARIPTSFRGSGAEVARGPWPPARAGTCACSSPSLIPSFRNRSSSSTYARQVLAGVSVAEGLASPRVRGMRSGAGRGFIGRACLGCGRHSQGHSLLGLDLFGGESVLRGGCRRFRGIRLLACRLAGHGTSPPVAKGF